MLDTKQPCRFCLQTDWNIYDPNIGCSACVAEEDWNDLAQAVDDIQRARNPSWLNEKVYTQARMACPYCKTEMDEPKVTSQFGQAVQCPGCGLAIHVPQNSGLAC